MARETTAETAARALRWLEQRPPPPDATADATPLIDDPERLNQLATLAARHHNRP